MRPSPELSSSRSSHPLCGIPFNCSRRSSTPGRCTYFVLHNGDRDTPGEYHPPRWAVAVFADDSIRLDQRRALDRTTRGCIAGGKKRKEERCRWLFVRRGISMYFAERQRPPLHAQFPPTMADQTDKRTGLRSCRDGVLASNAEGSQKEDGCRKSRSQRGSNSITRTIQTPPKNPVWRRSPKMDTMHELGADQAYHGENS